MKRTRDIMVLLKQDLLGAHAIEKEVSFINQLLHHAEKFENFVLSHELIDINRNKIIRTHFKIRDYIRNSNPKPFIFLYNRN